MVSTPRLSVKPKKSLVPVGRPVISGVLAVGNKLTASLGTWSPQRPSGYKFQWLRNGKAIKGAIVRLDPAVVKMLTLYVHTLGGGE